MKQLIYFSTLIVSVAIFGATQPAVAAPVSGMPWHLGCGGAPGYGLMGSGSNSFDQRFYSGQMGYMSSACGAAYGGMGVSGGLGLNGLLGGMLGGNETANEPTGINNYNEKNQKKILFANEN